MMTDDICKYCAKPIKNHHKGLCQGQIDQATGKEPVLHPWYLRIEELERRLTKLGCVP